MAEPPLPTGTYSLYSPLPTGQEFDVQGQSGNGQVVENGAWAYPTLRHIGGFETPGGWFFCYAETGGGDKRVWAFQDPSVGPACIVAYYYPGQGVVDYGRAAFIRDSGLSAGPPDGPLPTPE
jgi:hypothetical protein